MGTRSGPPPASAQRALAAPGLGSPVVERAVTARTWQQAADALGSVVGQIARSLVFRGETSDRAARVVAAGGRRVDKAKGGAMRGEPMDRAGPAFARRRSGFATGGMAPLAHATPMTTFFDTSLRRFDVVRVVGGTPKYVYPIAPADLLRANGAADAAID